MKIKKNNLINLYLFLAVFFIYTNYIYGLQGPIIIGLTIFLLFIQFSTRNRVTFNIKDILFVSLGVIFFLSSLKSPSYSQALSYSIAFISIIISVVILEKEKNFDYNYFINLIFVFSSIHVLSTIIYQLTPNIIQKLLPYILKPNDLVNNLYEYDFNGIICGITPIQGLNALYISSFIMVIFSKLYVSKKRKILNVFLLIFGFIALFLTSKRGLLLANIISIIALIVYYRFKTRQKNFVNIIRGFLIALITFILGFYIINNYFSDALEIFERFKQIDFLTGRDTIWEIVINNFITERKINGSGLFSSRQLLLATLGKSNDVHNIYLQILVETGVFGFIIFMLHITSIIKTILKIEVNNQNKEILFPTIYLIIVFLVYGFSGNWYFDITTLLLFYLIISIICNKNIIENRGEKDEDRNINIS